MELEIEGLRIAGAYRNGTAVEVEFADVHDVGFSFEGGYRLTCGDQVITMTPMTDSDDRVRDCFAPLVGVPVDRAVARESGELWVRFVDGSLLESGPGDMYEPWAYYGPNRLRVWSLPGGRITTATAP